MSVDTIAVGTLILVKPGDRIPMDGEVVRGASTVDESMLTGEAMPVKKGPESAVCGGTLNSGRSPLEVLLLAVCSPSAVRYHMQ